MYPSSAILAKPFYPKPISISTIQNKARNKTVQIETKMQPEKVRNKTVKIETKKCSQRFSFSSVVSTMFLELLGYRSPARRLKAGLVELRVQPFRKPFAWEGIITRSGIFTAVNQVVRPKASYLFDLCRKAISRVPERVTTMPSNVSQTSSRLFLFFSSGSIQCGMYLILENS